METIPYTNWVENTMYKMMCYRPNLSRFVSTVSKFMEDLGHGNWNILNRDIWI